MTPVRRVLTAGALAGALALTGCTGTPLDSVIEGLVGQGTEQLQGGVEGLVEDALGGTAISSDGQLPDGFPADAVPVTGTVLGGGSGPNGTGWAARTQLGSAAEFENARAALEAAGFTASAMNAESGFGTFTSADYTVVLVVAGASSDVTATYIVTPA